KLETLAKAGGDAFDMPFPPRGERKRMPSLVSAFAQIVRWRVEQLHAGLTDESFKLASEIGSSPVAEAMFALKEPKTGTDGTMSWTVDVLNPRTGDDFVLGLKEITLPDGITRPYSVWLSGEYPRALDGLCKILSLDMDLAQAVGRARVFAREPHRVGPRDAVGQGDFLQAEDEIVAGARVEDVDGP